MDIPVVLPRYNRGVQITNLVTFYDSITKEENKFKIMTIDPALAYAYEGDFFGLLMELDVDPNLFIATLYVNELNTPYMYNGKQLEIKIAQHTKFKGR